MAPAAECADEEEHAAAGQQLPAGDRHRVVAGRDARAHHRAERGGGGGQQHEPLAGKGERPVQPAAEVEHDHPGEPGRTAEGLAAVMRSPRQRKWARMTPMKAADASMIEPRLPVVLARPT